MLYSKVVRKYAPKRKVSASTKALNKKIVSIVKRVESREEETKHVYYPTTANLISQTITSWNMFNSLSQGVNSQSMIGDRVHPYSIDLNLAIRNTAGVILDDRIFCDVKIIKSNKFLSAFSLDNSDVAAPGTYSWPALQVDPDKAVEIWSNSFTIQNSFTGQLVTHVINKRIKFNKIINFKNYVSSSELTNGNYYLAVRMYAPNGVQNVSSIGAITGGFTINYKDS